MVAAVLAVAFGVVFQAWGLLWSAVDPVFAGFRPAAAVMVGVWLIAGVVGALVIRKPGAALFVETVAAMVSALLGAQWGLITILYGVVQGLAVELVFAAFLYRRWQPRGGGDGRLRGRRGLRDPRLHLHLPVVVGGVEGHLAGAGRCERCADRRCAGLGAGPRIGPDGGARLVRGGSGATHHVTTDVAIRLRGWGWRHAGRSAWAVRGVDLEIEPGERVLLLGASGAGKSTLLLGIAGLLDPDGGDSEGEITVGSADPRTVRGRTGLVLQDPESQIVMARAGDDVAFGLENLEVAGDQIWGRVDSAMRGVRFPYGRDHATDQLSGGETQRLVLAGTFALEPPVLLLDEPTANLDPAGAALVRAVVRESLATSRRTLVMVEHRVAEVLDLVDRVVVLEPGGGVFVDGDPGTVFVDRGRELAAMGVWVPNEAPPVLRRGRPGAEVLVARGLGFGYPGAPRPAVAPTGLALRSAEALAVVGPNGSGKSTLALLLAGLLAPSTGDVVGGTALAGPSVPLHRWPARVLAAQIGTVFQDPEHQFLRKTVADELAVGPRLAGFDDAAVRHRVDDLLGRLHLAHLAAANPFTLSGGEKRRLSVATALATDPRVLVLDEPTFGQDRRTWLELLALLDGLRGEGAALVCVTHDQSFVEALADRVLVMQDGVLSPGTTGPRVEAAAMAAAEAEPGAGP